MSAVTHREIDALEAAHAWKKRSEEAEAKLEDYARRQDEMAAQIERLLEGVREASEAMREALEYLKAGEPAAAEVILEHAV